MAAAGPVVLYSKNKDRLNPGDVAGAAIKIALITSVYTPDATATGNSLYADVSANEIATAGQTGYSAGGIALTALAVAATGGNNGFKLSSANPVWTAATGSIPAHRFYVIYVLGTLWGRVNPLIGYFLGDATPTDVPATTVGNTLTVTVPTGGWFDAT